MFTKRTASDADSDLDWSSPWAPSETVSETLLSGDSPLLIDINFLESIDALSLYLVAFAAEEDDPPDPVVNTELLSGA
ncbi:hypothetical protein OGATHE_005326 [Ogataea polymorpha]|uniref:Uncharacterized protein n=1 Tax=Ogataea polymorpha TaxID=460523 RepID=A0A9P8T0B4_9ASCO|nr:hypothetical protein OGATHE_005326 [Ogataea polymorpha]